MLQREQTGTDDLENHERSVNVQMVELVKQSGIYGVECVKRLVKSKVLSKTHHLGSREGIPSGIFRLDGYGVEEDHKSGTNQEKSE